MILLQGQSTLINYPPRAPNSSALVPLSVVEQSNDNGLLLLLLLLGLVLLGPILSSKSSKHHHLLMVSIPNPSLIPPLPLHHSPHLPLSCLPTLLLLLLQEFPILSPHLPINIPPPLLSPQRHPPTPLPHHGHLHRALLPPHPTFPLPPLLLPSRH